MSDLQLSLLGQRLVLWLKKEQIVLDQAGATALYEQLGELLAHLSEQEHETLDLIGELSRHLDLAQGSALPEHMVVLQKLLQQAYEGEIMAAWQAGVEQLGEECFANGLSKCWTLDGAGWARQQAHHSPELLYVLLTLTAWAPEGHALDLLWRSGAFDRLLLEVSEEIPPEALSSSILGRALRLLTQEQPIAPGGFWMGNSGLDSWTFEQPEHWVELTRPFAAMLFPVKRL